MRKGKFTIEEHELFNKLAEKKEPIQLKLNELKAIIQADNSTNKMVRDARAEIFEVQKGLVPFSEMQAGLAGANSRDKYFSHLSKNDFIQHVKDAVK